MTMNRRSRTSAKMGNRIEGWPTGQEPLETVDREINSLIKEEKRRQGKTIELIASENFTSRSVMEAVGSCLTNKYSDGYAGLKFYGGTEMVDRVQDLCQQRALDLFSLDPDKWGVNVQPYSGSPANYAVFMGVLKPRDRLMGLDLPDGGHQSHGSDDASTSITSTFYQTLSYKLNPKTHLIDYEELASTARFYKPKLIIAGTTTYSRLLDFKAFRKICDDVGAILLGDIAHTSGLVAANLVPSPFDYCDIITTTTHKTLRGPKAALIYYRRGYKGSVRYDYEEKINKAVFPAFQGGAHIHSIAGVAVALKLAKESSFREYQQQVLINAKVLVEYFQSRGYDIVTGGTDTHLLVIDLKSKGIDGSSVETICDLCSITITRIHCPGDTGSDIPSGIRLGSPALTSRHLTENDFLRVANFLDRAIKIAIKVRKISDLQMNGFENTLQSNGEILEAIQNLRYEVEDFIIKFPLPGFRQY